MKCECPLREVIIPAFHVITHHYECCHDDRLCPDVYMNACPTFKAIHAYLEGRKLPTEQELGTVLADAYVAFYTGRAAGKIKPYTEFTQFAARAILTYLEARHE